MGLGWACIFAGLVAGLYLGIANFSLWFSVFVLVALVLLGTKDLRMRAVDWSALLICIFEIPSLLFSQSRANSIRAGRVAQMVNPKTNLGGTSVFPMGLFSQP
jgi:hypothetical protein